VAGHPCMGRRGHGAMHAHGCPRPRVYARTRSLGRTERALQGLTGGGRGGAWATAVDGEGWAR
jgi:hypothetical protein